ncbi:MAG: class I SAM-dependent methyltransferase [Chloroflexi bacterium]|nr:class I SAM-dependent methyltransferase [Chloroflexota bacterium]
MTESELRQWSQRDFAHKYLEIADIMIVGRKRSLDMLKSFYRYFLRGKKPNRVLDLGCGDGVLAHELLNIDDSISATLVDGSNDMLEKAREKLVEFGNTRFVNMSFQELTSEKPDLGKFEIAVSSLAIHHLTSSEKADLFKYVFSCLVEGGYFVVIDCTRSQAGPVEDWFLELWRERIEERQVGLNVEADFEKMYEKYTETEHYSRLDTMDAQMNALRDVGFSEVDCYYKHGLFAMFGGKK